MVFFPSNMIKHCKKKSGCVPVLCRIHLPGADGICRVQHDQMNLQGTGSICRRTTGHKSISMRAGEIKRL